jgi:hypothetical protein
MDVPCSVKELDVIPSAFLYSTDKLDVYYDWGTRDATLPGFGPR